MFLNSPNLKLSKPSDEIEISYIDSRTKDLHICES
jgi:hypothetical protein